MFTFSNRRHMCPVPLAVFSKYTSVSHYGEKHTRRYLSCKMLEKLLSLSTLDNYLCTLMIIRTSNEHAALPK